MMLRAKTRKRLIIVLAVAAACVVLVGGAFVVRLRIIDHRAQEARIAGMAAYDQGNWAVAMNELSKYRRGHPSDPEVNFRIAEARLKQPLPGGRELGAALPLLRQVLAAQPDRLDAAHALLDIYGHGMNVEARALAEQVLQNHPEDVPALKALSIALLRLKQQKLALPVAEKWAKAAPQDIEAHLTVLTLLQAMKEPPEKVLDYAQALQKAHPDDARYQLVMSVAYSILQQPDQALNWARKAAAKPIAEPMFARVLVSQLDNAGRFDEGTDALAHIAVDNPSPDAQLAWMRRLWQVDRYQEVVDRLSKLDPTSDQAAPSLVALKAMALARVGDKPAAEKLVAALRQRADSGALPDAWADVVELGYLSKESDPKKLLDACETAAQLTPDDPLIAAELARARSLSGDQEAAQLTWQRLAQTNPGWAQPLVELGQTSLARGQVGDAIFLADLAVKRAPHDQDARVLRLTISTLMLKPKDAAAVQTLQSQLADAQQEFPNEPRLMALRMRILAATEQTAAAQKLIDEAIAHKPAYDQSLLIALAQISEQYKLERADKLFAASQQAHGETVELAFARAQVQLREHNPDALKTFQAQLAKNESNTRWQLAWAHLLEVAHDSRAKDTWIKLATSAKDDTSVQWQAVAAPSVQDDHAFIGETLDRLKKLVGENSLSLAQYRAQWLLRDTADTGGKNVGEAITLLRSVTAALPQSLPPRLMLAQALERQGDVDSAISELISASDLRPDVAAVALDLARLLHQRADNSRARVYLKRVVDSKAATREQLAQAGALYRDLGDMTEAARLLKQSGADETPRGSLLLATMYMQQNQTAEAEALLKKLLEKPTPDVVRLAIDFYVGQNRPAEAQQAIKALKPDQLKPGELDILQAMYDIRTGDLKDAEVQYLAAVHADPKNPALWRALLTFRLAAGNFKQLFAEAAQAKEQAPDDAAIAALLADQPALETMGVSGVSVALAREVLNGSPESDGIHQALLVLAQATKDKQTPAQTVDTFGKIASQHPRSPALQYVAISLHMAAGQLDQAATIAARATDAFPTAVEPVEASVMVAMRQGNWPQALAAAREWRKRSESNPLPADMAIANTQLELKQPAAARQQLQPYLAEAQKDPQRLGTVLTLTASAYAAEGRPKEAEALLFPMLKKSIDWRQAIGQVALRYVQDEPTAVAWVEKIKAAAPADSTADVVLLSELYRGLASRSGDAKYAAEANQYLTTAAQAKDASAAVVINYAMLQESQGDLKDAGVSYRRGLKLAPENAAALNNLAMLQVKTHGDLQEGLKLATEATKVQPGVAAFYDTRCQVNLALGDTAGALESINKAIALEPQNPEWQLSLADVCLASGDLPRARQALVRVQAQYPDMSKLPADLLPRYQKVQKALQAKP